jgi:hypothetical protein
LPDHVSSGISFTPVIEEICVNPNLLPAIASAQQSPKEAIQFQENKGLLDYVWLGGCGYGVGYRRSACRGLDRQYTVDANQLNAGRRSRL